MNIAETNFMKKSLKKSIEKVKENEASFNFEDLAIGI